MPEVDHFHSTKLERQSFIAIVRESKGVSPLKFCGEVAEWLMAPAWKACLRESVTGVRIPLSPPDNSFKLLNLIYNCQKGSALSYQLSYRQILEQITQTFSEC